MKVSVIIPAHNEESVIGKCLASCFKQVVQPYEVIVVNDGSTDRTEKIALEHRASVIHYDKGHSAAFARNRGAEAAKGDVVFFLDADQELPRNDFLKILEQDIKGVDGVICPFQPPEAKNLLQRISNTGYHDSYTPHEKFMVDRNSRYKYVIHAMRKKTFKELGGYDESIFYFEDADLEERFYNKEHKALYDWRLVYYNEYPETFWEFIRQAEWMGRGAYTMLKKGKFYLKNAAFWSVYVLFLVLSFVNVIFLVVFIIMNGYILAKAVSLYKKSHDFIGSLALQFILGVRSFFVLKGFIAEAIK